MKKYKVWTHIDTGIGQTIGANNEDEAIEKAKNKIANEMNNEFDLQIKNNLEQGKTEIVD